MIELLGIEEKTYTLNLGPQHPSTHGVLRFVVKTDGEMINEAIPDVGYLHRSIEKIGEKVTYHGYVPYTDRADYLAAMFANQAFCMAAEKLGNTEVARRGEFCRAIACELNRIASHLISVGTFGQDIGAMSGSLLWVWENFPGVADLPFRSAQDSARLTCTISGARVLGSTCLSSTAGGRWPRQRAASTNSISFTASTGPRATRAKMGM